MTLLGELSPRLRSVSQVNPSLRHVEKILWMGEILFGMGFMTYKGL
jgi:hypothetical protein